MPIAESYTMQVQDLLVQVVRKSIKNLHLRVYPPNGAVRVTAPWQITEEAIRAEVLARLTWIKKHQRNFQQQESVAPLNYVSGEKHYYWGEPYFLRVHPVAHAGHIQLQGPNFMDLYCRPEASRINREALVEAWHRQALKERIPALIAHYEPLMGVRVAEWGVKRMRTRWGTCNIPARRIWLSLGLTLHPEICLEYVVVHEMAHLLERLHNDRFKAILDRTMPDWRRVRSQLR
ncbi:MAG: M48 family metallopeptidase [Acidithiobacillus sp.]